MKITIGSVHKLDRLIGAISKLVESCEFDIDNDGCVVRSTNRVERAFFKTDVLKTAESGESVQFCPMNLTKMRKSIQTLMDFSKEDGGHSLEYDGTFVKLNGIVKFKFKTVKRSTIEDMITVDIKTELETYCSFKLNNVLFKKLMKMAFVSDDEEIDPKIYIYKENNAIVGEIDDKTEDLMDSISIPISTNFDGDWTVPLIITMSTFKTWNLLDAKDVLVEYVGTGSIRVIRIRSSVKDDDSFINVEIISPRQKA
jgi:hypothetical protein